jgi:hypothetical protein
MFNPKVPILGEPVPTKGREAWGGLIIFYSNEDLKLSLFLGAVLNIVAPVM